MACKRTLETFTMGNGRKVGQWPRCVWNRVGKIGIVWFWNVGQQSQQSRWINLNVELKRNTVRLRQRYIAFL